MMIAILKVIRFVLAKNGEARVSLSKDKQGAYMLLELWIDLHRYGWMTVRGLALNDRPSITNEPMNGEHLVVFNPLEKVAAYLLIRHYLKKDVRRKMKEIVRKLC